MKVVILGCNFMTIILGRLLEKKGKVIIIDTLETLKEFIKDEDENSRREVIPLPEIEPEEAIKKAGIGADIFLAATENENKNILAALLAKELNVPKVICLVETQAKAELAEFLGLEVFNPLDSIVKEIHERLYREEETS